MTKKQKKFNVKKINMSLRIYLICFAILIALFFLICYFALPAFNFTSGGIYFFFIVTLAYLVGMVFYLLQPILTKRAVASGKEYKQKNMQGVVTYVNANEKFSRNTLFAYGASGIVAVMVLFLIVGGLVGSHLFRANDYYQQLEIKNGTIEEFKDVFDYSSGEVQLPVIDKALALKYAQAKLSTYGAQYSINDNHFTLISVHRNGKDELIRVTPLEYSNNFVALNMKDKGSIGYIEVNVITKEAKLVLLDDLKDDAGKNRFNKGLVYLPSSVFSKDLDRHLRCNYPTKLFADKYFEIDDEGNPYWVVPTHKKQIGLFGGSDSNGVVIVNPVNGDHKFYKIGSEPAWVDRVIDDEIVETQATNALTYKHGFFNSVFGSKKDVLQVSDGYNYFIKNGHAYYVSCITSPNEADQTSVGFITIDLKTREAIRYDIPGITEMRTRDIAMNDERVKAQALDATWPILINYNNIPTYFVVLKNEVQEQKYVFVNVDNGGIVAMGNTLASAKSEYESKLTNSGASTDKDKTLIGNVVRIRDTGEELEFLIDTLDDKYCVVNVDLSNTARFLNVGDNVTLTCKEYEKYFYVTNIVLNN